MENENENENTVEQETVETVNETTEETENRGQGFESRSRDSLEDEIRSLRREAASKRQAAKESSKTLEGRIAAMEATITSQTEALKVERLKALGLSEEDVTILKGLDEETAKALASRLASKKQTQNKIDPNQLGMEKSKTKQSAILSYLDGKR